ncbi:Lrp/AsnC family transcriptional regulator [Acidianus sulfidivorans JP7]|uniref:siroheme decarboxylase n=2 Tax=Acidianus TaxID=12914 RepID=A0A2U9IQF3_9CREN|nr:Lrp/AsnC family transcriptional regulator [Acidianus sulfidivorans JP7]
MELEYNFPLSSTPYAELSSKLGISEDEIIKKVKIFIDNEIIKRIGMYINFRAKGMEGALVAADIPLENLEKYRRISLGIHELTHNFIRNHPRYNVWLVIKANNRSELDKKIENLMEEVNARDYVTLYSKKSLKLSVKYDIFRGTSWSQIEEIAEKVPTAEELGINKELLKELSLPLPIVKRPFENISKKFNMTEDEIIDLIYEMKKKHVVKDYGATLNGEKVGIKDNAMLLLNTDNIEEGCNNIALNLREATHVVLRESNKPWDYLCYCMLHGRDKQTIYNAVKKAIQLTNAKSYMILFSLDNLKPGIVI